MTINAEKHMMNLKTLILITALGFTGSVFATPPVNINTADAASIAEAINGVGLKRAAAIVAYRKQHGEFKTVEDLAAVRGIGESTVAKNRTNLKVK